MPHITNKDLKDELDNRFLRFKNCDIFCLKVMFLLCFCFLEAAPVWLPRSRTWWGDWQHRHHWDWQWSGQCKAWIIFFHIFSFLVLSGSEVWLCACLQQKAVWFWHNLGVCGPQASVTTLCVRFWLHIFCHSNFLSFSRNTKRNSKDTTFSLVFRCRHWKTPLYPNENVPAFLPQILAFTTINALGVGLAFESANNASFSLRVPR